jgi:uncharacterized integral membrane protein
MLCPEFDAVNRRRVGTVSSQEDWAQPAHPRLDAEGRNLSLHENYDEREEHRGRSPAHTARLVAGLVLLAAAIAIVVDNHRSTSVGYVVGDVRAPLIVVMLASGVVGAVIGWLLLHRARRER